MSGAASDSLPDGGPSAADDVFVVRRIVGGDVAAFEQLMRRLNRRLYRLARSMLRDDAEAEDALQEAYFCAYRAIGRFRGQATLSTWLSRTVLNECLGRLRKQARRQEIAPVTTNDEAPIDPSPADAVERPDKALERAQMRRLIERKLDLLPEAFRVAFVMREVEELSVEEAAACLQIPEATVRSRHFRARGLLRESLARDIDLAKGDVFDFGGARCDRIVASVAGRIGGPPRS